MPFFDHAGLKFHYIDDGEGVPFIFQHGLGGDTEQVREVYQPRPGVRFIAFDCRGHGDTRPLGDESALSFDTFADDLIALMEWLGLADAVVGGISMGAGVALNVALRYPARVRGLLLSRPAWLDTPMPESLRMFVEMGQLIQQNGAVAAETHFRASSTYSTMLQTAPDVAASALTHFAHPRAEETAAKLIRIPNDVPNRDRAAWASIGVPTLVLANQVDPIHPYAMAETLAQAIPGALLRELTSKSINKPEHIRQARAYIGEFVGQFA